MPFCLAANSIATEMMMSNFTVRLTQQQMLKLEEVAARLKITAEELARIGIEDLLARPDNEFQQAADYVLKKNAELYRRLG